MRTSLFHRTEPRNLRRASTLPRLRRGALRGLPARLSPAPDGDRISATEGGESEAEAALGRVRAAGGPVDLATYACGCGMLFSAPVSTTVVCPHCGCQQDW